VVKFEQFSKVRPKIEGGLHPRHWRTLMLILGLALFARISPAETPEDKYRDVLLQIQQHIEQNDLQGAEALIASANSSYPANGGLKNLLGVVAIKQGRPEQAIKAFSEAITLAPALTGAYLNLGRIYIAAAEHDKVARASALHVYSKLLRREPDNPEANYQISLLLLWDGKFQDSLEYVKRLGTDDQGRISAQIVLCSDEAALFHSEGANKAAERIAAAPDLSEPDALEVLPSLRFGHRADLIDLIFSAANARKALSAEGLRVLGLALEGEGKLESSRVILERAFAIGHSPVPVLIDLTRVANAMKDYQGALGYLAHARDLRPNDAGFAYEFGVLTIRMGLLGESRKALGEAVKLEPNNPEYNFGMGVVSSFSQDATQGLPYLQKYHALRPSDPAALLSIGTAYFRGKNFESASLWLRQAVTHAATAADAHYYLGRIARVQARLADAELELEQANTLTPNRPDVLAELGQVFTATRDYSKAGTYLENAVALDPENYAANFGLLQLYARENDPRKDDQSKRFEAIKNKSEEQYQEMMRIMSVRANDKSGE
jgi:Flp pilus assembly protein TadD